MIYRLPIALRGLEPDVFGYMLCFFIEPMAQAIDDADNLYLAAREESHLQRDLTLDACLLCLGRVTCLRFRDHNRWSERRFGIHGCQLHVTGSDVWSQTIAPLMAKLKAES